MNIEQILKKDIITNEELKFLEQQGNIIEYRGNSKIYRNNIVYDVFTKDNVYTVSVRI